MWFILGYQANSQNKLIVTASGTGGFDEMYNNIVEVLFIPFCLNALVLILIYLILVGCSIRIYQLQIW